MRAHLGATCAVLAVLPVPARAPAQSARQPEPAAELRRFAPYFGRWHGEDASPTRYAVQPARWSAAITYRPVLGGHAVREDVEIEGAGMPVLRYRSIYGWDAERSRYLAFGISNMGDSHLHEPMFVDDRTMVILGRSRIEAGTPMAFRSTSQLIDGALIYRHQAVEPVGPWYTAFAGSLERRRDSDTESVRPEPAESAGMEAALPGEAPFPGAAREEMKRFAGMVGTWRLAGRTRVEPGSDWVPLQRTQRISSIFGGRFLRIELDGRDEGTASSYRAIGYIAWDRHRRCYREFLVSNAGEIRVTDGRWVGERTYVSTAVRQRDAVPMVVRDTMRFDDKGRPAESFGHVILGARDPAKSFEATYRRVE